VNTVATQHNLELTTPTDREIVMTRIFDAPRALVWDAFTKPELIRRWLLGPEGWSMPVCEMDLRPGGSFAYTWRSDENGREFGITGAIKEIDAPDRMVRTERFTDEWYRGEALVTTTFVESAGTTTVTMTILHETRESRDEALESGMEGGVAKSYDRLAGILAERT
jgi:uncharacterized protein YndB with AHSA1/START domain